MHLWLDLYHSKNWIMARNWIMALFALAGFQHFIFSGKQGDVGKKKGGAGIFLAFLKSLSISVALNSCNSNAVIQQT